MLSPCRSDLSWGAFSRPVAAALGRPELNGFVHFPTASVPLIPSSGGVCREPSLRATHGNGVRADRDEKWVPRPIFYEFHE